MLILPRSGVDLPDLGRHSKRKVFAHNFLAFFKVSKTPRTQLPSFFLGKCTNLVCFSMFAFDNFVSFPYSVSEFSRNLWKIIKTAPNIGKMGFFMQEIFLRSFLFFSKNFHFFEKILRKF